MSFLWTSRDSRVLFISPMRAMATSSLWSAWLSCLWASAFLSSNLAMPTTSSIMRLFSSGVRSATLVAAPWGTMFSPPGESPARSSNCVSANLVVLFALR